jgi:hypothetical protein
MNINSCQFGLNCRTVFCMQRNLFETFFGNKTKMQLLLWTRLGWLQKKGRLTVETKNPPGLRNPVDLLG